MAKQIEGMATKLLIAMIVAGIAAGCGTWASHIMSIGHPVTIERLDRLQGDVAEIKADVKVLLRNGKKHAALTP